MPTSTTLSVNKSKGFTLVELLVVITIIAILSIIGLAFFGNLQKDARDTKRRGDIDAISKALEANYDGPTGKYSALGADQFTGGTIPTDPNRVYCYKSNTDDLAITDPVPWTTTTCPAGWSPVAAGAPVANQTAWKVCASLEKGTVFCKRNVQ